MLKKVLEFGHMVRFSHSLFAMPFAIGSMWVAAGGFRGMAAAEAVKMIALIVGCMVTARNSAMSFNRIADADIDAKNPRTAKRHLPAGRLSKASVIAFLAVNGVLFVLFAALLQPLAGLLALPVWLLLLSYSYWKRFSWLCHWFLGFAIGMSPLGAWIAIRGEFAVFPIFLLVILMLWMGGFDPGRRNRPPDGTAFGACPFWPQTRLANCFLEPCRHACLVCGFRRVLGHGNPLVGGNGPNDCRNPLHPFISQIR